MTQDKELPQSECPKESDLNPLIDPLPEIDFDFYKRFPLNYTINLCARNNYNPLIAYYFKKYGIKHDYAEFNKKERVHLNGIYFTRLLYIREGLLGPNSYMIIRGLLGLWKEFLSFEMPLSDLLNSNGIFKNCLWIWRDRMVQEINHDIIYPGDHFKSWKIFINSDDTLRNRLIIAFGDLANTKTEDIGALGFKNPLAEILRAKWNIYDVQNNIGEDTFSSAFAYLKYLGIIIDAESHNKKTEQPAIEQAVENVEGSVLAEDTPQKVIEEIAIENLKNNDRKLDGFLIPDWIDIKEIPLESKPIQSPAVHRIQGFCTKLRGYDPKDGPHDCRKSIARIAKDYRAKKGEYLVHCDMKNKCYWIEEKDINIFKKQKGGRKRRAI